MKKTYIFGHKKPDTDAVMSAIALSYLKNVQGENTEPRILSDTNKETKFALEYFNIKTPLYLNDVKLQIKDVNYHKDVMINENDSIYSGYEYMAKQELTGLPVINNDKQVTGLLTVKDLAYNIINDDIEKLNTSYKNILYVLKAEELLKYDEEITGNIIVASYRSTTFMSYIKLDETSILIVGDRHSIIEYAIQSKIKLIILTGNAFIKDEHIKLAKENKVNIIRTPYSSYHVAKLINTTNYIKDLVGCENPTCFTNTDYVDDFIDINNRLKHTNYPILNKDNKCLGMLKITDLSDKNPKNVILVDHNELLQSADGLQEANILEIIDHHNVGSITTNTPINFRNMSVGSTSTIIYLLYKEQKIEIPKQIAGALISGILSDTLILNSPTTTKIDIEATKNLSKILEIDYNKYGMELLKAGTSLDNMDYTDVLYNDFKIYNINNKTFALSQFLTLNFNDIKKDISEYIETLNEIAQANHYELVALYVTDIIKKGSYIIYNEKAKNYIDIAYQREIKQGEFIENCISRKKHIVPLIMDIFE